MRILHVLNHSFRLNGHVHAAIDLACAQADLGHSVALASEGGDFDELLQSKGVEVVALDQRRRPRQVMSASLALWRLLGRFDVAHAHMMTSALMCFLPCKVRKVPLITTVHNEFERSATFMKVGARVIGVSQAVTASMLRRGVSATRLRTVLNGTVGSARLAGPAPEPVDLGHPALLFVGGLHPRKGLPILLAAFDEVAQQVPEALLHIVGDGPYGNEYRAIAGELRASSRIKFHGGQSNPRAFMRAADILVLPSLAEPAGLVLSEACEAGCAVVGSRVGGIPEMLDNGRAGALSPPGDAVALARILSSLLSDPAALAAAKAAASDNVGRLSIDRVVTETLNIYTECLPPSFRNRTTASAISASRWPSAIRSACRSSGDELQPR